MGLTLKELLMWPPEIADLAKATRGMADAHSNSADFYRSVATLSTWQGQAADTAMSSILLIAGRHDVTADQLKGAAGAMDKAETDAQGVADEVSKVLSFAHASPAIEVNPDTNQVVSPDTSNLTPEAAQERMRKFSEVEARVAKVLADGVAVDSELAQAISTATGVPNAVASGPKSLQELLLPGVTPPQSPPPADQNSNRVAAFRQVYGHDPVTPNDWQMAAVLDPHSYDPRTQGKSPEIRVVKIRPVAGQGLVRMSQWIAEPDVVSGPGKRDFGNNRGPDPHFDPTNTKVTTYIDYEHGVVVMRQNPSVEQTASGGPGQAKVQAPQGSVTQTPDGAVRIQYQAANPFAPDIAKNPPGPLADHSWTVNGDLVFTPGAAGVHVDGTRGDYPWMEVYQDLPNGTTNTVLIDPASAGNSFGPMTYLPFHHDVGIGGRAFGPFDTGGWNPRYDVRVPLPSTDFGLSSDPPSVPVLPPTTATPS
ncbi:MAG: hypothetical protein WCE30_11600 [Mycobacterium sp.]